MGILDLMSQPLPSQPTAAFSDKVKAYVFQEGHDREVKAELSVLEGHIARPNAFIWLDIEGAQSEDLLLAQQYFGLHPLAVEDALHAHQRAKVEPYSDFWFVVMHSATLEDDPQKAHDTHLQIHETALFIGQRFILSVRHKPTFEASEIIRRWELVPESWRYSSTSLVYVIFDQLVDSFGPLTDEIGERLARIRKRLVSDSALRPSTLQHIFTMETVAQEAYSVAMTMRDVLPPFMRSEDESLISGLAAPYYRDVHDHAVAIVERLSTERDLSVRAFDIYHAMTAYQQGQETKQLAIVSTIFLPLTFLTGFFGQNFGYLVKIIDSKHTFLLWGIGSYLVSLVIIIYVIRWVSKNRS